TQLLVAAGLAGTSVTPDWIEQCANALAAASCIEASIGPPACTPPPGSLANGAPCLASILCRGRCTVGVGAGRCGTCTDGPPRPTCGDAGACPDHEVCAFEGSAGAHCAAL